MEISKIILPFIREFQANSVLVAGEIANEIIQQTNDTRYIELKTPFSLSQFTDIEMIDLAVVSDLVESVSKQEATQWLGLLKNRYTPHIILMVNEQAENNNWQLDDYLALGFKHRGQYQSYTLFSYAIESYQFKRDWLNSRYWANPENFDKFRW